VYCATANKNPSAVTQNMFVNAMVVARLLVITMRNLFTAPLSYGCGTSAET
jgi:hypothetical protein